mmetsp:Transcript_77269/g.214855  ORF Transcript_77269/g.214855 Transcript_77269/m.214855 type:complete len:258 (-) Transcript_77269:652-1425(-)
MQTRQEKRDTDTCLTLRGFTSACKSPRPRLPKMKLCNALKVAASRGLGTRQLQPASESEFVNQACSWRSTRPSRDCAGLRENEAITIELHLTDGGNVGREDRCVGVHEHHHTGDAKKVDRPLELVPDLDVGLQRDEGAQGAHPIKTRRGLHESLVERNDHHHLARGLERRRRRVGQAVEGLGVDEGVDAGVDLRVARQRPRQRHPRSTAAMASAVDLDQAGPRLRHHDLSVRRAIRDLQRVEHATGVCNEFLRHVAV